MTIKPVGRPLPAIPVKRPYGLAKPVPPGIPPSGSFASSGPPPEVIYGLGGAAHPPSVSSFPPSISSFPPSPGLISSYPSYKKPGPSLTSSFGSSKPVYETGPSEGFDYHGPDQFIDKKQLALRPSIPISSDAVQQHVHHHYHHGDAAQGVAGVGGAGFSPSSSIGYGQGYGSGGVGTVFEGNGSPGVYSGAFQDSDDYKKAFKVKAPTNNDVNVLSGSAPANSYADRYPVYEKPMRDFSYGKSDGQKTGKYYGGNYPGGNYFSQNTVQGANNDYAVGSSNNNYNYYGNDNENFGNDFPGSYASDCVCVPYEQCPSSEQAGRKDDLFLPIDPRNLNKNIQAEGIEMLTIVEGNGTKIIEDSSTPASISVQGARTKRDAGNSESESVEARKKTNGEGVRNRRSTMSSCILNIVESRLTSSELFGIFIIYSLGYSVY